MVRSSAKVNITNKQAPEFSGVFMRSLVKKMSSSKLVRNPEARNGLCQGGSHVKIGQGSSEVVNPQPSTDSTLQPQTQQHKKKVRRRLHTSRPYQERLLNMAEARREIVTALKFHRASMKQQQQQQEEEEPLQVVHQPPLQILSGQCPDLGAELGMYPAKGPMIHPSGGSQICPSSLDKYHEPWPSSLTYDSSHHLFNPSATVPSVSSYDHNSSFSFSLPSQTLGLNLNFQDFSNLSTTPFQTNPSLFTSPSSSSSSPTLSSTTTDGVHSAAECAHNGAIPTDNMGGGSGGIISSYPAMDSEVMKEVKSMGDCYDMVWNDTMNSLTSAWWLKFSNAAEISSEELKQSEDGHMFTQLSELPSWLNPDDSYLQPHNIACPEDSSTDPSFPCMDIGEIEGLDGDWLA